MKNAHSHVSTCSFILGLVSSVVVYGQKETRLYEKGEESLKAHRYVAARQYYSEASAENPDYEDLAYKLTLTTFLTEAGDTEPIGHFTDQESVYAQQDENYYYWLGQIYLRRYLLDEAVAAFEKFEQRVRYTGSDRDESTRQMVAHSQQVLYFFDHPGDYEIHQLPAPVNSESAELSPVYFEKTGELLFASDRGKTGEPPFVIYHSRKSESGWGSPTEVAALGTFTRSNANVEVVSEDGKLFLFREENGGDLFYSQPANGSWTAPVEFDSKVSNNSLASHFFINAHEDRIIFATRTGSTGLDIYESFKNPENGKWSKPAPFYSLINSPYDEDSPYLSPDEKTLYFSSDRPGGIGGLDVYVSHFNDTDYTWSAPKNLGWPVNSPDDEFHYKLNDDQSSGYLVSNRLHTTGDYDIYFFWHIEKVKIEGRVFDSSVAGPLTDAEIRFHPAQYPDEYFSSAIDASGRYNARIIANETFEVEIIKNGKVILTDSIEIHDTSGSPITHFKDFTVY